MDEKTDIPTDWYELRNEVNALIAELENEVNALIAKLEKEKE